MMFKCKYFFSLKFVIFSVFVCGVFLCCFEMVLWCVVCLWVEFCSFVF